MTWNKGDKIEEIFFVTNRFYTGIGSRKAPLPILKRAQALGKELAIKGFTGRSGKAEGMDEAFMKGFGEAGSGRFVNYLPYPSFRESLALPAGCDDISCYSNDVWKEAVLIARGIYGKGWFEITPGARDLHTRNVFQVLGDDLKTPSEFVLYWAEPEGRNAVKGGTNTAFQVARQFSIGCYNVQSPLVKLILQT